MSDVKTPEFQSGMPLYRQVQKGIEELIRARPAKQSLPLTDARLADRFGVSRITVRRAVDELVDAGVLYRIQGVGTFVRPRKLSEKLTLDSFLDNWTGRGARADVRVGAFEHVPANSELAERLNVNVGADLLYVQRLRYQQETLVAIDDRYLPAACSHKLTTQDIMTSSLVDFLRNREKISLARGEMEIEAGACDRREARIFGIKVGKSVLIRRVTFFTKKNDPILTGISTYRADKVSYRLTVSA
jgi:GntR family transcriptional regulator